MVKPEQKTSNPKNVKSAKDEKDNNSENVQPEFIMLGEVYSNKTQAKRTETDLFVQNGGQRIEADPTLFDIEDESPVKSPKIRDSEGILSTNMSELYSQSQWKK